MSSDYQARQDAYVRQCQATIAEHGWMIQAVFPTESAPGTPFAYTVGLSATGLPELVISGLPGDVAGTLLNDVARRHLRDEIKAGDVLDKIASAPLKAEIAPKAPVGVARRLYGIDAVTTVQLVWPDRAGHYPDDPSWALGSAQEVFR